MKIILKRAAILGGKRLEVGRHELPDSVGEEWMFNALVKDGHIDIIGEAPSVVGGTSTEGGGASTSSWKGEPGPAGGTEDGDPAGEGATESASKPQGNNRKKPT